MESIFSVVFEKAEPQLNLRWLHFKNVLGLPHHVTFNAVQAVAAFAEIDWDVWFYQEVPV